MATVKELRDKITANREALKSAIEAASGKWEDASAGDGDQRNPRQIAEHAIGADVRYAGSAAAILGGNPVPSSEISLASAQEAVDAIGKLGPEIDKRFSWAEDRDLSKQRDGRSLEQIMESAASHLAEHAGEIKS
ncbi:MAG: hypothetical protein R3C39_01370 [Dehalococcoidia bacterium]